MDIHVTNKTSKSWEVVYVVKVRQLLSKHGVSKIVLWFGWWAMKKSSVLCCIVIDACTTSNDV